MKVTWRPSWIIEAREPAFIGGGEEAPIVDTVSHGKQKYLWGNVPALDLLNLQQNEGVDFAEDLRLLFAASGDIRNVIKSLTKVPATYTGHCEVVINDKDPDIVARNAILLLVAIYFSPEVATSIMLHIWYSALVSAEMLRSLQNSVLPLIQEVCKKIQAKSAQSLLSKVWTFGTRSLRLVLTKEQWDRLPSYFEVPDGLSMAQAQAIRASTTLAPERKDYLDRALLTQPPTWRVCRVKFREDGIILPFGASREELDTPNPTFYQTANSWPMMDSADPLEGWPMDEIIQKAPLAKNDLYGNRGYLGPMATLAAFGPLLKRKTENPSATMVALFLNAVHEVYSPLDYLSSMHSDMERLRSYLSVTRDMVQDGNKYNPEFIKFMSAQVLIREFD
ncbi:MAG: hypothetical protein L6R40_008569 [Gallowayella cf. fulva]|nr:MAG: hypothetical protein L6R40_008569 [Xanthomendoza cf. fulva]